MNIASILVIEDSAGDRELVRLFFERHHVADYIEFVSNIASAKEAMQRRLFDLIFIDENLPDGSGVGFSATLDKSKHDVVILSGNVSADKMFSAAENGAIMYIQKPLDDDDLRALLKEKVRLKQAIAVKRMA